MWARVRSLWRALHHRSSFERGMDEELRFHLETRAAELVARGLSPNAAARRARLEFGNPEAWQDRCREARGMHLLDDLAADLRFAWRGWTRRALLSAIVVATLAFGIGIGSGVFTLFDAAVLTPHIASDPESFAQIFVASSYDRARPGRGDATLDQYRTFSRARTLRAVVGARRYVVPAGPNPGLKIPMLLVTCNFFDVNGGGPALLGRLLGADDCEAANPVIVMDEGLWRAKFNADPAIVGSALSVNGGVLTVVGIAPQSTAQFDDAGGWAPYTVRRYLNLAASTERAATQQANDRWLGLWGRLAPGTTRQAAAAELSVLAAQDDRLHPGRATAIFVTNGSIAADPGKPLVIPMIALVMAALGCVLVIACANVATLLLAQADARQQEIAIRLSLGAGRGRVLRMMLTETLLLAAIAGAASVYVAHEVPILMFKWFGGGRPAYSLAPGWRPFTYLAASTLVAGLAAGLAPAIEALRVDVLDSLKGRRSVLSAIGGSALRNSLIGVQVALSFVLLVGAGLFVVTHYRIMTEEPGFESAHLLIARAAAVPAALEETLTRLPGTRAVAFARAAPMSGAVSTDVVLADGTTRQVDLNDVSPGYLSVVGLPLVRGRSLNAGSTPCSTGSCEVVVSEGFVRTILPAGEPIGRVIRTGTAALTIVGVVRDSAAQMLGQPDPPIVYSPWTPTRASYQAVVRFSGDPATYSEAAAAALRRSFAGITDARTARWYVEAWIEEIGPVETLILALGAATACLAVMGVYGVVSFSVSRRRRELAVRIALGARALDIYGAVIGIGARPAAVGLAAGVALAVGTAAAFANTLAQLHFAVGARDPLTYGSVAVILTLVILAALTVPARRAARVDPLAALRCE